MLCQVYNSRYSDAQRIDNITDWAHAQFRDHYIRGTSITKDGIFSYVYAVLHDPVYRESYSQNLKRDFPHIPFYPDFKRWRDWGETLFNLHANYEDADPFPVVRTDIPDEDARTGRQAPRVILKADRDNGIIMIDGETQLSGVPTVAWKYKLGNRSAIDWLLDQHKEKKPRDPIIREKFNTYRFADHKERIIDLLARVVTVSVRTLEVLDAMRTAQR